ncbi:MAG: glycoside hydrolase family 127 protein [Bacteroidetes bacterium]|nr:glycoside hydrolase family 127 protein [Bacteroidota bacterium]
MRVLLITPFFLMLICNISFGQDAFSTKSIIAEKEKQFPVGELLPKGWLLKQFKENLDGFVGHLDALVPDLITADDIYNKDRLSKHSKPKVLGNLGGEGNWQTQLYWWNSETQSNWWDGYIRTAIITKNNRHLKRIQTYVNTILATQDADGYLGIYNKDLRFNFNDENGELWAKATLLRGLLAWYEYAKDEKVLSAVKKAVKNTIEYYPLAKSHPFFSLNPNVGGLSHGLTFIDVLESLYHLTGDKNYLNYLVFLYKDFSEQKLNEDAQLKKLIQPEVKLFGHGVHTYEHLRCVAAAYYATGNPQLKIALDNFEDKIRAATTVSGGPVGDEWIGGMPADETKRGYEYCSIHELLHSYASLLAKSGKSKYADDIEQLFFNAAQGARHPGKSCIAYLKSDNSYYMTGGLNGDTSDPEQTRYRYSPTHREAAVCCVPNAGRIGPYFLQYMWLRNHDGVTAALLGPCELKTKINNIPVRIIEKTEYPFNQKITFTVYTQNNQFSLRIRKPGWLTHFALNVSYVEEDGYIVINKTWNNKDKVELTLFPEVKTLVNKKGEYYFQYGGLVLAHEIKSKELMTKKYAKKGFGDYNYTPVDLKVYNFVPYQPIEKTGHLVFQTKMKNQQTGQLETIELKPMGETILRQVSFGIE